MVSTPYLPRHDELLFMGVHGKITLSMDQLGLSC